ncbi:unnamed protein product [Trichogramma brassicae]|uniref:Uncharacterized protein n=1 Tax=Trichogramma brassicae TaxID=86971 RepID=A0A6H5IRQ0_9HYME|nr:unnamed protein product [Trichogramma brassicae]
MGDTSSASNAHEHEKRESAAEIHESTKMMQRLLSYIRLVLRSNTAVHSEQLHGQIIVLKFQESAEMYAIDARHAARLNQENLVRLKRLRGKIHGLCDEHERNGLLGELVSLMSDWQGQPPNLRDIFLSEEIDWLVTEFVKRDNMGIGLETFIDFVIRSGYKDEPELDEDGKPLSLRRTTPLHRTVRFKPVTRWRPIVRELFKIYARLDVDYTDESGLGHFHVACMSGCVEVVERFLELGQEPNVLAPETGDTPLLLALSNVARSDVVESLLRGGADPNLANEEGKTPLHVISRKHYIADFADLLFDLLEEKNQLLRVDARDKDGRTPLYWALYNGHEKLVESLLRKGADPNLADEDRDAPLHVICKRCPFKYEMVELFLKVNHDLQQTVQMDARDKKGRTALSVALGSGCLEVAKVLLRNGADPNAVIDTDGSTPLHLICKRGVSYLSTFIEVCDDKQRPLQIDAQDRMGNTPLHLALLNGNINNIESLLRSGADPSFVNNDGSIPLHLALSRGQKKVAETLLKNGSDPNQADARGLTALHVICKSYHDDDSMLDILFESQQLRTKVLVDAKDEAGWTPLRLAVASPLPHVVDVLLNHGADLGSGFAFPTESDLDEIVKPRPGETSYHFKLRVASGLLLVVEHLENKGYRASRSDALTIMKLFDKWQLFEKSSRSNFVDDWFVNARGEIVEELSNPYEHWYDDEEVAIIARSLLMNPSLSLYELIHLPPEEAIRLIAYKDYHEFWRSGDLRELPYASREDCALHLCEKLSRGFFRRWALERRCDVVPDNLNNQDLWRICLGPQLVTPLAQSNKVATFVARVLINPAYMRCGAPYTLSSAHVTRLLHISLYSRTELRPLPIYDPQAQVYNKMWIVCRCGLILQPMASCEIEKHELQVGGRFFKKKLIFMEKIDFKVNSIFRQVCPLGFCSKLSQSKDTQRLISKLRDYTTWLLTRLRKIRCGGQFCKLRTSRFICRNYWGSFGSTKEFIILVCTYTSREAAQRIVFSLVSARSVERIKQRSGDSISKSSGSACCCGEIIPMNRNRVMGALHSLRELSGELTRQSPNALSFVSKLNIGSDQFCKKICKRLISQDLIIGMFK